MRDFLVNNVRTILDIFIDMRSEAGYECDEFEITEAQLFINLVIRALEDLAQHDDGAMNKSLFAIDQIAEAHGRHLLTQNFPPSEIVHYYGAICQSVMNAAAKENRDFHAKEYEIFNQCLDHGIAGAISGIQEADCPENSASGNEYAEFLHEMRNLISTANLALAAIKKGHVGIQGATGVILDRSLGMMTNIVSMSLDEVKLHHHTPIHERFSLIEFIDEFSQTAALISKAKPCSFSVQNATTNCLIDAERAALSLALLNIVQNAFKFTKPETEVILSVEVGETEAAISIADHCGGIPGNKINKIFAPFVQENTDKSGLGLGLSIARRTIEDAGGRIEVINRPGIGCIFKITLPTAPPQSNETRKSPR